MSKPIRKAAGLVIYRKNVRDDVEYLLVEASSESQHWTPPKGHLEEDEAEFDAAIRETKEETGITVKDIHIYHHFDQVIRYEPKNKPFIKQVTYWLARLLNPNTPIKLSHEHLNYEWLTLSKAKEKAAYPELQKVFDECEQFIAKESYEQ